MKSEEKKRLISYCIDNNYNPQKLSKLKEQRLDNYDRVMLRQSDEDAPTGDGLKMDANTIPKVIFEYIISTGEILEREWTKLVMQ